MKAISWIVILTGLALATGCTTSPPSVTGTEGIDVNSGNLQTVATDTAVAGLVDSDNDSIEDSIDVCPDTSTRVMVDESGCEFTMGVIEGLKFGINELALSNEAAEVLDKYIAVLVRYPDRQNTTLWVWRKSAQSGECYHRRPRTKPTNRNQSALRTVVSQVRVSLLRSKH